MTTAYDEYTENRKNAFLKNPEKDRYIREVITTYPKLYKMLDKKAQKSFFEAYWKELDNRKWLGSDMDSATAARVFFKSVEASLTNTVKYVDSNDDRPRPAIGQSDDDRPW